MKITIHKNTFVDSKGRYGCCRFCESKLKDRDFDLYSLLDFAAPICGNWKCQMRLFFLNRSMAFSIRMYGVNPTEKTKRSIRYSILNYITGALYGLEKSKK